MNHAVEYRIFVINWMARPVIDGTATADVFSVNVKVSFFFPLVLIHLGRGMNFFLVSSYLR